MRYGLGLHQDNPDEDRTAFPAQSSVLDEEALLSRHVRDYDIPPAQACRFLSRGDADIYRVTTTGPNYYLKVYRPPYTRPNAEAEARFVTDLAGRGIPVVAAVPRLDGGYASEAMASEGLRPMLLFTQAPSVRLSDIDGAVCRNLGGAIARLHEAADVLESRYELPVAEAGSILQDTLPYAGQVLPQEDCIYMEALAGRVRERLAAYPKKSPDFGLCHGDLVLSNLRHDAQQGITFFDFGNAHYTWRSYELAVVYHNLKNRMAGSAAQLWEALLDGYADARQLPADLPESLPVMLILRQLGWIAGNSATLPLRLGTEPFDGEIFHKTVESIRAAAKEHSI